MLKKVLQNLAYHYYPKDVSCLSHEAYGASAEFKRLTATINGFFLEADQISVFDNLLQAIKDLPEFRHINIVSRPGWNDRCLIFELNYPNEGTLDKITILISLLVPYYLVYVTNNRYILNPYRWITSPRRSIEKEQGKYQDSITTLKDIVEAHTGYNFFPIQFVDVILPELSFQDVMPGNFTLFNAFFLDDNEFSSKDEEDEYSFFDEEDDEFYLPDNGNV